MAYETTYKTLSVVMRQLYEKGIKAYLIGGISAAIQTNTELYRQNTDLDIMVDINDLEQVINVLQGCNYVVDDKRGVKTRNYVDAQGEFIPADHELNANSTDNTVLDIGIFVYQRENGMVTMNSYAYDEREQAVIGKRKVMPEELFDLMHSDEQVNYYGTTLVSASKEYTYISKTRGKRAKDRLDAIILEPYIDKKFEDKMARIMALEKRVTVYLDKYNEKGEVQCSTKVPEFEDAACEFVQSYTQRYPNCSYQELLNTLLSSPQVAKLASERSDVACVLEKLKDFTGLEVRNMPEVARHIAHLYCYSDNFEEEYADYVKFMEFGDKCPISRLSQAVSNDADFANYIETGQPINEGPPVDGKDEFVWSNEESPKDRGTLGRNQEDDGLDEI